MTTELLPTKKSDVMKFGKRQKIFPDYWIKVDCYVVR